MLEISRWTEATGKEPMAMKGHFENYPSARMVLQTGLQYVSKFRSDAAL